MEENEGTQICPNCNREIPKVNFVTHSLHCSRNIKICPVCKEPVLLNELEEHNDKLHQLLPCKQCGERVRGTDMEDHVRDSCAFTMQTCRYCSLDIRRRDAPAHERYCGARTERCAECGEYVQLRYNQLHIDSNHGFIRLNEDVPVRPAMRRSGDAVPSSPPLNSRPRFPPFVPITDIIRPASNREDNLQCIAELRALQRETQYSSRLTNEELRFKLLASMALHLHDDDDDLYDFEGLGRLSAAERVVANSRGNARSRPLAASEAAALAMGPNSPVPCFSLGQNFETRNIDVPDVFEQNGILRDVVQRGINGPNIVAARNADAPDLFEQNRRDNNVVHRDIFAPLIVARGNAGAPDVVEQNGVGRNVQHTFGQREVSARNSAERNGFWRDGARQRIVWPNEIGLRNVDAPDVLDPNGVWRDVLQHNIFEPNVVGARNADAPGEGAQNTVEDNATAGNLLSRNELGQNASAPDVVGQNAMAPGAVGQNGVAPDAVGQNGVAPDAVGQNEVDAVGQNRVAPDAVGQNGVAPDAVGQNGVAPDAVGQNEVDAVGQNRVAPDAVGQNGVAPDAIGQNGVAPGAIDQNGVVPEAVGQNMPISDAVPQNVDVPDEIANNVLPKKKGALDDIVQHILKQNALRQNGAAPDAMEQNAVIPQMEVQNESQRDLTSRETEEQNAEVRVAEAGEGFLRIVEEIEPDAVIATLQPRHLNGFRTRSNYRIILKRTNDQPQINTAVTAQDKVTKKLGTRGAVKKRPAPVAPASPVDPAPAPAPAPAAAAAAAAATATAAAAAPTPASAAAPTAARAPSPAAVAPAPDSRRDLPYYSALQRRQDEDRRRQEQTAYNLSVGLPPVLDPAAKLEKLRKMDALHKREDEPPDYRSRLTGRVWADNNNVAAGHTLGRDPLATASANNAHTAGSAPVSQPRETEQARRRLADVQPMSAEQFMQRFNELRLIKEPRDIRSSLRELRRGLNEVTAPYNNANNNNNNHTNKNNNIMEDRMDAVIRDTLAREVLQLDEARALEPAERTLEDDMTVPCEFCCQPLRLIDIFDHERACEAALSPARARSPGGLRAPSPWDDDTPVIPCEFCTEALPYYLINEHQELCGRESHLLYPD